MTAQQIADLLNDALKTDWQAVQAMFSHRVPCNQEMLEHPTIVVRAGVDVGDPPTLGLLGLLNGIVAIDGESVAAIWDVDTSDLVKFVSQQPVRGES